MDKNCERFQRIEFVCLFLFFTKFRTFLYFSRCNALGNFLIPFLEIGYLEV